MKLQIIKDSKRDYTRKNKELGVGVIYSKFKAKTKFKDINLEFEESEFHKRIGLEFKDIIKKPKNRVMYGEDFMTSGGDLIILHYFLNSKGKQIIKEVEII